MKNRLGIVRLNDCELIRGHGQAKLPEHTHKSFTLVLILDGNPEISVNGKNVVSGAGTVIILPPDNCISMKSESTYDYWSLSVHDGSCRRIMNLLSETPQVFKDSGFILSLFLSFETFSSQTDFVDTLAGFLLDNFPQNTGTVKDTARVAEKARAYIENHVRDEISISDVASFLNVTTGYLSRVFRKSMHITPKQYLIQCRLREAKKEMLDKGSDADIAYGTGFASQSHLCTVFKKYMGISVGDYERIVRTKKCRGNS